MSPPRLGYGKKNKKLKELPPLSLSLCLITHAGVVWHGENLRPSFLQFFFFSFPFFIPTILEGLETDMEADPMAQVEA